MQRPLHFDKICQTTPAPPATLQTRSLLDPWYYFQVNTLAAVNLATIPGFGFWMGGEWATAMTLGCAEVAAKHGVIVDFKNTLKAKASPEEFGKAVYGHMSKLVGNDALEQRKKMGEATLTLESFITQSSASYMHNVLENIIRGVCFQAWTATEILLEQMFRAVEAESLSNPQFARFPQFSPADWQDRKKNIGFTSLLKIRNAYNLGFQSQAIADTLNAKEIEALALLRNIIAHKASIADQKFLDRLPGVSPLLDRYLTLRPGLDTVSVDGELVRSLVDSAFKSCYTLISHVDAWQ